MRQRARHLFLAAAAAAAALAACADDDDDTEAVSTAVTTAVTTAAPTAATTAAGSETEADAFPADRCEANRDAGTITYLSGFDFAATASIVDVVMADQQGYFEDMCLDVELQPSFSTANYPIVAAGEAQFASGGSFSELVNFAAANEADLVAVAVEGRSAIDSLILEPGVAEQLEDLAGTTIGVKGAIPPSVAAMLASVGLVEGEDYETVLLDGFDPLVHIELPGIVGFPGYKSNEPGQLERAGVDFDLFAPSDFGIPGSFGVLYTTRQFLDEHPTAVQDFLRASMRGLADAMADPEAAARTAIERVEAGGNPNFLSLEGETFRWTTDVELLRADTPAGTGVGVPDPELLQAEVDAYADVGLFGDDGAPDISDRFDVDVIAGVYDDTGEVIWPGS
jgi:NitT/TauT family transport system substrate-binding protein